MGSVDYTGDVAIGSDIVGQVSDHVRRCRNVVRFLLGNTSELSRDYVLPPQEMMEVCVKQCWLR